MEMAITSHHITSQHNTTEYNSTQYNATQQHITTNHTTPHHKTSHVRTMLSELNASSADLFLLSLFTKPSFNSLTVATISLIPSLSDGSTTSDGGRPGRADQ